MSRHRILELGAGPADEPCAQLGQCADFAEANTLELLAYKAAIIALNGEPPLPLGFALVANAHDFGTYRTLWLVSAELPLPEGAQAWLDDLVEPATWIVGRISAARDLRGLACRYAPIPRRGCCRAPDHPGERRRQLFPR
ncbi:MAG: hypothetical protein ACOVNS_06920 [Erythrobacter sp.]